MNRFIQKLSEPQRLGVIPFFMLGDPNLEMSFELIKLAIESGVDALELGIPFSDPIADGPVVSRSAERALKAGANIDACLMLIHKIREISDVPIGLLMYFNLILRQGMDVIHQKLKAAGVDAILAVDLPLEEAQLHEQSLDKYHLGNISLIAPNTDLVRAKVLLDHADAFAYVVSSFGTTGVRRTLPEILSKRLSDLKSLKSKVPLVVGFGISEASQIKMLRKSGADAVIIGSALTKIIEANLNDKAKMHNDMKLFLNGLKE